YGAQQDNTTVIVPSLPLGTGQDFRIGPGCETGPIIPDPTDADIVYGSCKGQFSRLDMRTTDEQQYWIGGQSLYGNPGSDLIYRFQRVSPMEVSPNDPRTVYYGSQYLHRTRDGGVTWEKISPDLTAHPPGTQGASGEPITRDATGEEVYSTLYSIRESPVQRGLIWTGSNDGLVYVTRDDGKSWKNVTPPDLKPGGRVQNIEPSPHRAGTAYVAIYRYLLGDFAPYIYRTDDYGQNWQLLTDGKNGISKDEPTRVVREDPDRAGLLYAGTEFGMYISFDNGKQWQPFRLNLPATPVTDIKITHKDMVLSTQGRSFWILDNLTPLHQLDKVGNADAYLFAPREAVRSLGHAGGSLDRSLPHPQYPLPGAQIDYYLASAPAADITLEILDESGKTIRRFSSAATPGDRNGRSAEAMAGGDEEEGGPRMRSGPTRLEKTPGMHRFTWDLRYPGPWMSETRPEGPNGPAVAPGKYTVRLVAGTYSGSQPLTVIEDPRVTRSGVTEADLREQLEHNMRVRDLVSEVNRTVARVRAAQKSMAAENSNPQALPKLNELASHLITPSVRYSKPELQTHITYLYMMTNNSDQKIGRDAAERYGELRRELEDLVTQVNQILGSSAVAKSEF
ncbi:MAG: hypothetical protein JO108_07960, partial [Acidobacteriaceae bacterium]|nr:hypothetical protein [Acidobacteriaceae bacterium]